MTSYSQHRRAHAIHSISVSYCGVVFAVLVASALLLAGCGRRSGTATTFPIHKATSTPVATLTPPAFSLFHEWRAAYITSDKQLHAVTLDGKNDTAGPYVSPIQDGFAWTTAGISPDGHYFAFQAPNLTILDVTHRNARTPLDPTILAYRMAWSPQGDTLAVYTGPGTLSYVLIDAVTGQTHHVPGISTDLQTPGSVAELIGWIDATHLAVTLVSGGPYFSDPIGKVTYALSTTLASLDITTSTVRHIASISSSGLGFSTFTLSPDGTRALFYNTKFREYPFTPLVDVITIATGRITPLPNIAQTTKSGFISPAWRPGSDTVAIPGGSVLDLDRDTVTDLNLGAGQWWVEGWTPDAKTLIFSSDWGGSASTFMSPHTISALTFGPNGQTSLVILTHDAYLLPFVGFVRTA